jgi:hypothetical protein
MAYAETAAGRQKTIDTVLTALERPTGRSELLLVPKMDARLISDFYIDRQVRKRPRKLFPDHLFRMRGEIGAIEIEKVVVKNSRRGLKAMLGIPNRLKQAAAREIPLWQIAAMHSLKDLGYEPITQNRSYESALLRQQRWHARVGALVTHGSHNFLIS